MRRHLFLKLVDALQQHDDYFVQKRDAAGILGLSPLQKMTAAIRMLAYGTSADSVDDYVRIEKSTALESLKRFLQRGSGKGKSVVRIREKGDIAERQISVKFSRVG
jgi:hypothetical protein